MPKVRVYEIAKQLDMNSKVLAEKLKELGIEGKNHMSTLEDRDIKKIEDHYKDGSPSGVTKKPDENMSRPAERETPRPGAHSQAEGTSAAERFERQAVREQKPADERTQRDRGQRQGTESREQGRGERPERPAGQRPPGQGQRPQGASGERSPRLQGSSGERSQRPQGASGERGPRPQGATGERSQRPQGAYRDRAPRPQGAPGERSQRPQGAPGERGPRPQGAPVDRGPSTQRPQGDRSWKQEDRGARPQGYKGPRPEGQGERTYGQSSDNRISGPRPDGQRPQGASGERSERPARPYSSSGDRPPRYQGQRPQDDRSGGQRPQGQGARPQGQGGQRPPGQGGQRPMGQGGRPPGQGGRPQGQGGQRPQGQGGRPQGQGGRPGQRPVAGKPDVRKDKPQSADTKNEQKQRFEQKQKFRSKSQKGEPKKEKQTVQDVLKKPIKPKPVKEEIKVIQVPHALTVKELAAKMNKSGADVIKSLIKKGMMVNLNQEIDYETATNIALEFDIIAEEFVEVDLFEQLVTEQEDREEDRTERPPVVVVMGHVDHGKTSLLDYIRHSKVTSTEAGGITQHIGAYTVSVGDKPITFLDTPGHEAFTAMRMRGAQVTDIAVLVVAADDGVMPQTVEAINHAKAANVEIIVAINKIDRPSANPDRVKQELTEYGLLAEDWGGETICVPVSALNGEGIDQLLEMIILVSEMKELKANPKLRARGTVVEALLDKGRGPVATILVQDGTLNPGDPIVAGSTFGRVRAMTDDKGRRVKAAGPSIPVEIIGLSDVPQAGDMFYVTKGEKEARQLAEGIVAKSRLELIKDTPQKVSLDDLFTQIKSGAVKDLNIVVKADVQGSVEAVKTSLEKISNEEVRVRTIHGGEGAITESDVMLASASNAIIIGFNVRPEAGAKSVAETEKVDIRLYRIIYNAIEDVTAAMKGMLEPIYEEKVMGHAEIRQIFKASGVGTIGGSYVTDGKITRNAKVRIVRDGIVAYEGTLESLRRHKDDIKEVNTGYECGLLFSKFNDIKEGDVVEAFSMEEIPR